VTSFGATAWRRRSCLEWGMAREVGVDRGGGGGDKLQQLKEAARDRVGWRDVVRVVISGRLRPDGTR